MPAAVRLLPLELQVCFFLQPWSETAKAPSSVHDWAVRYGWVHNFSDVAHMDAADDRRVAVDRAVKEAERVAAFVREVIDSQRTSGA